MVWDATCKDTFAPSYISYAALSLLVPWRGDKFLVWDATCKDTFAPSHISYAALSLLVPWRVDKFLVWDATCKDTFAPSYISYAAREACLVAKQGAQVSPSGCLPHLCPSGSGDLWCLWQGSSCFNKDFGHRLEQSTGEAKSGLYLLQRMSVAVQRGNTAAVLGSFQSPLHKS